MIEFVTLGRTGLNVNRNSFGALPIQRISKDEAVYLLQKAFYHGFNYFDTARVYTDSEEKLGEAFRHIRNRVVISSKSKSEAAEEFTQDLDDSLRTLQTDYIDLYQFHNLPFCPRPGDGTGLYEAALKAKAQGKIRHIGISTHKITIANEAVESALYETLQFPFSYLSGKKELALIENCRQADIGFIAMKALAGGLLGSAAAAYAYMRQFPGVVPIWGIQRESELDEFLSCQDHPPELTGETAAQIRRDCEDLSGKFCRACGYCMPCPAGIEIDNCARISLLLHRMPAAPWLTEEWQQKMERVKDCLHCGQCKSKCPYELDTPALLEKNYVDYQAFL